MSLKDGERMPKGFWRKNKNKSTRDLNSHICGSLRGASKITPPDVGDGVLGIRMGLTESLWFAISRITRPTKGTWSRRIVAHVRVQPIHVHQDVIPHAPC